MFPVFVLIFVLTRSSVSCSGLDNSPNTPLLLYINRTSITYLYDESQIIVYAVKTVIDEVLDSLGLWADLTYDFQQADVFINFKEDIDVASTRPFAWSVWPTFQQEFCFVYAASKKLTIHESMSKSTTASDVLYLILPVVLTSIYHALILRYRLKAAWFDAVSRGPLYSLQIHMASAMPNFNRFPHYKAYLIGIFSFNFVGFFVFLTYFSALCTVPEFVPDLGRAHADEMYRSRFGYGSTCLMDLKIGKYVRQSCLVTCKEALLATVPTEWSNIGLGANRVDFRHILKVSSVSPHFEDIRIQLLRFDEAGFLTRIFDNIHEINYKQLITSHSPAHMQLHDIVYFMLFHIVGMALASIVFALELLASRLAREQSTRANHTKPECVRKY